MIVPAAGRGTRLHAAGPKLLVPVDGVPMIDRLLAMYREYVVKFVVVVHPDAAGVVAEHLGRTPAIELVVQPRPTGMLDAILLASAAATAGNPAAVWITWCDQVGVHPLTVERLASLDEQLSRAAMVFPTVHGRDPYVHLERDARGVIARVLHRREGDAMPEVGESDMGLFSLSSRALLSWLPAYAREVEVGTSTGERNFLPFIPWLSRREEVITYPSEHPREAVGINTPEDLRAVEEYLRERR